MLFALSVANGATTLMEIGRSPFHQPPLTTIESLVDMVRVKETDIRKGFEVAGRPELAEPFISQLPTADIEAGEFAKGTSFEWMFFKKKGKGQVRVARDVTWGNEKPFPGFKLAVDSEGQRYTFVIPLGCGNIALMDVAPVPVPAAAPVAAKNQPPVCTATVSPAAGYCGDKAVIDATGSTDSDGTVVAMSVVVTDAEGKVVSESAGDASTLVSEIAIPCGTNMVTVTVIDDDGEKSTSPECTTEVRGEQRARFLADAGYYHMPDPGHYLFGRVGLEYKLTDNWALLGLVGYAEQFDGIDGDSAFLIDFMGEYSFSRYFVDFGVGGWFSQGDDDLDTEDTQIDFIVGAGARLFGEPDAFNTSIFVEVRAAADEFDDFIDYGRFGAGLRFRF